MEFKFKTKMSENKKYDLMAKTYINYFVDPVYNNLNQIDLDDFSLLSPENHPCAIVTSNWNFDTTIFKDIKQYNPKYLLNFTKNQYNNQKLSNEIEFKSGYQFMAVKIKGKQKFKDFGVENAKFLPLENNEELKTFIANLETVFAEEVSDTNKFNGIFEKYKESSELFTVKYNDEIVGTGHLIHFKDKVSVVDDISMLELVRGKGLATFLMKSLINKAIEKGQEELYLFGSDMALNIYKKLGFEEENYWMEQYKVNF